MGAISFSLTGLTTVTFARADAWPRAAQGDEGQITTISEAGLVRIATMREPIELVTLNWSGRSAMLVSDYVALGVFLKALPFRARVFTFTDVDSSDTLVRYWQGYYGFQQITPLLIQGQLVLRKDTLG